MKTIIGEQIVYDNFTMGAVKNPEDNEQVYIVFTDKDNEQVHMFTVAIDKLEQFFQLIRQTAAGQKIEVVGADRMPRG